MLACTPRAGRGDYKLEPLGDSTMIVDWSQFERAWVQSVSDALGAIATDNPRATLYAGAIWQLYGDYTKIGVPLFAVNAESSSRDVRWHPPDWRWSPVDSVIEAVQPLYDSLSCLSVPDETFEALFEQHVDMLSAVCHQTTASIRAQAKQSAFPPNFFVGVIDFSQGDAAEDYLARSVDAATIEASKLLEDL